MLRKLGSADYWVILRFAVILCFILFAGVVRVLPHPWNFTPVGALALFSGAKLGRTWQAFLLPCAALFCSDVVIGLHSLMPIVYFSFCLSVLIGIAFRTRQSLGPLSLAIVLGALQFFLITNLAVRVFLGTYPQTFAGLLGCYLTGFPLFANTLAGDACYALLFFGGFALLERRIPALRSSGPLYSASYTD